MKKNILAIVIVILILVAGVIVALFVVNNNTDTDGKIKLNQSIRLVKGQTIKLVGEDDVSLTIKGFNYCPTGAQCQFPSIVNYELNVNGTKYTNSRYNENNDSNMFMVEVVSSDYKTYAEIKIYNIDVTQ